MKNKFLVIGSRGSLRRFIPSIFATALTLVFSVEATHAASLTWDGADTITAGAQGGAGNWNVNSTANWWDGAANVVWPALGGTDDDAVFGSTAGTVTLTSAITANDLTFNTTGYILSGAQTLTLNGTTPTITVGTSVTATIGNGTATVLAGSSLTKAGDGILVLSGSAANTYTGITTINGGTVSIAADTALGTAPGAPIANQLTLNGGALRVTANSITLAANRGVTLGASGGTFDFSARGTGETFTVGGIIAGTGALTLNSSGDMSAGGGVAAGLGIKLNQATNTYIGDTTITSGLVAYASNASFGDAANKIILNGGGLLDNNLNIPLSRTIQVLAGGGTFRAYGTVNVTWSSPITGSGSINRTDGGTLTLSGDLSGYSGTFNNQGGNTTLTGTAATIGGNWNLAAGTTTVNSSVNQALAGNLTGAGAFVKDSAGILTLSGSNNHTGATTITAGTIRQGVANAVSLGGALTVNGTGVFDLNTFNASVSTLGGAATAFVRDNAAGTGTSTLSITNAGSSAVTINNGATRTVALRVSNAVGAFALTNTANTFSGGIILANGAGGTRMTVGTAITGTPYGSGSITVGESATDAAGIYFTVGNTLANPLIINTALGNDRFGFRNDGSAIVLSGLITANADAVFSSNSATASNTSITNKVTGAGGLVLDLSQTTTASTLHTVTLNTVAGTNDYAGNTQIGRANASTANAYTATLALGASDQIPNGAGKGNVIINNQTASRVGILRLAGFSDTINGLSGNGTVDGVSGTPTLTVGDNNTTATFTGNITGPTAITKTGSGTQTFSGVSTYTGGTSVNVGTLIGTSTSALGTNSGLTIGNGAAFAYRPTAAGALSLGSGVINLASGSRIGAALGGTLGQSAITSSGAAVTVAGPVTLDVFVIPGVAPAAGTHNLITAGSGLNNATYSIGSVFNAGNYTLSGLSQSDTAVSISTAAATPLTAHFWKGGFSDGNNIWAISNGTSASNWASDAGGTNTSLTPGPTSTVSFSATGATNQGDMILGANMSIAGMVVNDTNAIVLNTNVNGFALTLGTGGMQINSGAGAVTIAAPVILGAAQSWLNGGSAALTLTGTVANGGFTHTLGGSGPIALSGTVSGTGALTKTGAGALTISSAQTYTGLTSLLGGNTSLTNSNALATTTVEPNGGSLDFGALTAASLGGLQGTQNLSLLNLSSAPITLSLGNGNTNTSYSGVLSGAAANLVKVGTGTTTLTGINTYSGTTTVSRGTLQLGASAPTVVGSFVMNGPDLTHARMLQANQFASGVVASFPSASGSWNRVDFLGKNQSLAGIETGSFALQGGGVIQNRQNGNTTANSFGPATLTLTGSGSYYYNGHLRNVDGGTVGFDTLGVTKTGSGTQALQGSVITYTDPTVVNAGTLRLVNTTAFASPINNAATVEFNTTAAVSFGTAVPLSGAGTYNKTGTAILQFNGSQAITATGQINIQEGTLQNNNNVVNWTNNKADINVSSGAILDLFADAIFLDVLTGSGIVQNNFGNTTGQSGSAAFIEKLVLGTNDGTGTFAGLIRGNVTNAPLAANTGGGGLQLEKVGTGTQSLTGTNLYTGSTTVTGGILKLDFAVGGTSNIIAPVSALVLGGGTLEIQGGSGEVNTQSFGGISGTGKLQLTQNGATSINVSLGAVNVAGGLINFAGSDATVAALGNLNFLTPTTTLGNDGTSRLGPHLWNGTGWASTSATGGNHVVQWIGTYTDLTTDGNNLTNPGGELRIIDGVATGTAVTYGVNTTAESLLMAAPTYATTLNLGANTLTLGNGAGAVGSLAANVGAQAITVGATAGQGFLTAGTSAAASTLAINNQSSSLVTINSVISNNAATGVVSLASSGNTTLNAVNTFTGSTTITAGTLTIGGAGTLGTGTYAGAIANSGSFVFGSSATTQTLSGVISGNGTLAMNGSGTLTLSGANTPFTGAINVNSGTLRLGIATGLGTSSLVTVASGGTLDLNGLAGGRPVFISGKGAGSVGALYNSSTTVGASIGNVTLNANASIASAVPVADIATVVGTGTLNLNGNTLTITGGTFSTGIRDITSGNININSGATLYSTTAGSQTSVTGTITINTGGRLEGRDTDNTAMGLVHTIALNGGTLSRGVITGNNGGGAGVILKNNITVDATNGGTITNFSSGGFTPTYRLAGAVSGSGPLTLSGDRGIEFQGDTSGYTGTATATNGTVFFNPAIASQTFVGNLAGSRPVVKNGANLTIFAGNNTYSGTTTVNAGILRMDYGTNDNRKIGSGALTLSSGTIELAGGTFADSVASTTLTAATSNTITRSSGTATLDLGAITFNTTGRLNLAQSGIARTTNANNALGLLGSWATISGSIPAMNDGTGLIVAATTADLTRLSSGSKVIVNGAGSHVRFIEGTGTAASFTLGAATTTISTLTQSAEGGVSAATVELASQRLVLNTVTTTAGAGALTIASAPNLGFLKAAGTSLEFRDLASVGGITVNAIIEDGTGATTVTKTDPGTLTFAGTNSYTGGTVVTAGTLTASLGTTAGTRFPFGSAAVTANSGTTLRMFAGSTANAMTFGNVINLNTATLTSEDAVQTYTGNIALTGANTVNVTYAAKDAIFSGVVSGAGSLTKASAGLLTLANANTYSGGTTISAGTIRTANTAALGAVGQAVTLSGGTLQLATDATLSSKNLTLSASSTITLDRANSGAGITTTFGSLTFGNGLTLTVNNGANVTSGISTLNFTGFTALGGEATTTTFALGANVEVNISGSLTGTQSFARVTKSGAGTLILSGNNNFWDPNATGLITISGGTLDLRSQNAMGDGLIGTNRIDLSMAAATTLRLGTDTSLGNNANVTLTGSGATIISDRASAGPGITNQFNVLNIPASTLNVTGGSNVTSGTAQVNFNSATLTGNAVLNVVNPTAGSTNMLVSGIMSGAFSLTKSGSGTLTLQGANTYSTTTAISGGTLNLSGTAGAIASSTGITLSTGGILTLANTSTANNTNRIAGTLAMNGGTLNFTNNAGAVNYSEATGALSVGGGANTIATSQAATGQTSILTFASLARTAGTLDFSGTGLGTTVNTRNEIRFTTAPTLTNGIIGTWATVNGTDFATVTGANNSVVAYSAYTDVTRLSTVTQTIPNTSTANVRIIEGAGTPAAITLAAPITTISTINQSISGGSSAATIDPDAVNTTLSVSTIFVSSGAGGLTIGTTAGDGNLRNPGTALQVIENSTGGSTINSAIINGSAASSFTKSGTGLLTLTGTNTYTGVTTVEGGTLAFSTIAAGGANSGIGAAPAAVGNLVLSNGTLRYTGSTASSDRGFTINAGTTGTVDVSTSGQTLTLSGGSAATNGSFLKTGAGTLLLSAAHSYTGGTTVTAGTLTLGNATNTLADAGAVTLDGATATLSIGANSDTIGAITLRNGASITGSTGILTNTGVAAESGTISAILAGTAGLTKTTSGTLTISGINTFSGTTAVNDGIVNLNSGGGSGAIRGALTIAPGATVNLNIANALGSTQGQRVGAVSINGGTLHVANTGTNSVTSQNITFTGGSLTGVATSKIDLRNNGVGNTNIITNASATTATISVPTIGMPGNDTTITTAAGTTPSGIDLLISSAIINDAGTGGAGTGTRSITKAGAGVLSFSGVSTYTGNTTVSAGTLTFSGTGTIYNNNNTATVSVATGAQIVASGTTNNVLGFGSGATWTVAGTINSSGTGAQTLPGTVTLNNGTLTGVANGTFGAFLTNAAYTTTLTANGASNTISSANFGMSNNSTLALNTPLATDALSITSPLGLAAQTGALTKSGLGTVTLTGANLYTGGTTLNQGTLTVGTGGTLGAPSGALAVNNNNTGAATAVVLNLATAVNTTTGSLSGTIAAATPASPANTATINVATGRTLTVNQTAAGTYAGAIAGLGGLTLGASSTNTLTLTGVNTYTGATSVSAGTLALVGGSQASPITVSSGASLSFTLGSPTTSTSSFNVTAGTIKITGPATLPSYTLISASTGITGTPTLATPIAGYLLKKVGNTLVLENPYEVWAAATGATGGKNGDPDFDGIVNLLEYAFGTNPTVNFTGSLSYSPSVVPGQPVLQENGGIWYAVFARRTDYLTAGLTYTVQFSSALSSWEATATAPTLLATDGTIDVVRVPFLNFVDINGPNGPQKPTFFRVQVSQ